MTQVVERQPSKREVLSSNPTANTHTHTHTHTHTLSSSQRKYHFALEFVIRVDLLRFCYFLNGPNSHECAKGNPRTLKPSLDVGPLTPLSTSIVNFGE
jgi:hypothetical protein